MLTAFEHWESGGAADSAARESPGVQMTLSNGVITERSGRICQKSAEISVLCAWSRLERAAKSTAGALRGFYRWQATSKGLPSEGPAGVDAGPQQQSESDAMHEDTAEDDETAPTCLAS